MTPKVEHRMGDIPGTLYEKIKVKIEEAAEGEGSLILSPFYGFPGQLETSSLDAALRGAGSARLLRIKKFDVSGSGLTELPASVAEMKNLEILDASYTRLKFLPKTIGALVKLKRLDVSRTGIDGLPRSLGNCRGLAYSRRHAGIIALAARASRRLSERSGLFMELKKALYSLMYRRLDRLQRDLDICGWKEKQVSCRRADRQCCSTGGGCEYLGKKGCSVESLACKLWLCQEALAYIEELKSSPNRFLRKGCLTYLRMRRSCDEICRALDIRFKGRASREDVFNPDCHSYQNTAIDRWYDNLYHRPWGEFISVAEAGWEHKAPPALIFGNGRDEGDAETVEDLQ
jgi:hypothetical protein